ILLTIILAIAAYLDIQRRLVRQRVESELRSVKNFLDTIVQSIPMPIAIKDADSRKFILVNRAYEALLGEPRQRILGTTVLDHFSTEAAARISHYDAEALKLTNQAVSNEFSLETKGKGQRLVTTSRIVVRDSDQRPQYLLTIV